MGSDLPVSQLIQYIFVFYLLLSPALGSQLFGERKYKLKLHNSDSFWMKKTCACAFINPFKTFSTVYSKMK